MNALLCTDLQRSLTYYSSEETQAFHVRNEDAVSGKLWFGAFVREGKKEKVGRILISLCEVSLYCCLLI